LDWSIFACIDSSSCDLLVAQNSQSNTIAVHIKTETNTMIKAIASILLLLSIPCKAENLRSNKTERDLSTFTEKCYLYDIQGRKNILTLGGSKHYEIAPLHPDHKGYSIQCDFAPSTFDYMQWYFPDG